MKQSFTMHFLGQELVLPKNIVNFEYGLGIVNTCCLQEPFYCRKLFGIVDKNFNIIVPLILYDIVDKFTFINSNAIILKLSTVPHNILYVEILDETFKYHLLPFLDFEVIDNELLKVTNSFFTEMYAFYNINKNELVTPYFHYISDFCYDENKKDIYALAVYLVYYDEEKYNQVITYINSKGEIVSPYLDCYQGKEYDQSMSLDAVLSLVREDMKGYIR